MPKKTLQYTKGLECNYFIGTLQECLKMEIALKKQGYITTIL